MALHSLGQHMYRLQLDTQQHGSIRGYYENLSSQQIRELKTSIEEIKKSIEELESLIETEFRFDIVANLPVELIPLVFQHLELYQSFQCRHVSSRWREILCADRVVKPLLQPWRSTDHVELRIPSEFPSMSISDIYAEHQDAFQTGNAFSRFQIPHNQTFLDPDTFFHHAYCDGSLAWVAHVDGSDLVYVHDLETGKERTFVPPGRESIDDIGLSQDLLVVMTTSARCYIWAHATSRPPFSFRTPSRSRNIFRLSRKSFVLVQIRPSDSEHLVYQSIPIIVWKLRESWLDQPLEQPPQATVNQYSTRIQQGGSAATMFDVYVDRSEQHIIIIESLVVEKNLSHAFRLLHLSFDGRKLFEESKACSFSENLNWNMHESSILSKDWYFDVALINCAQNETGITHLRYSPARKAFNILEKESLLHNHDLPKEAMTEMFLWKGMAYLEDLEYPYRLRVMDFHKKTCLEALLEKNQSIGDPETSSAARLFLGDERFLVKVTSTEFIVWCFDKHVDMAGEDESFRKQRCSKSSKATRIYINARVND